MVRAVLILLVGALVSGGVVLWRLPAQEQVAAVFIANDSVRPATFASFLDNQKPILIDIRTPEEFADAHIAGAMNIDFYAPDFQQHIAQLDRTVPYAIYCRSGNRTGETLRMMRELGFTYVYDLAGGILAWETAGYRTCNRFTC